MRAGPWKSTVTSAFQLGKAKSWATMRVPGLSFMACGSSFSMNGGSIPLVKRIVRQACAADGRRLVERLLELTAADEIEREVRSEMAQRFPGLLDEMAVGPVAG